MPDNEDIDLGSNFTEMTQEQMNELFSDCLEFPDMSEDIIVSKPGCIKTLPYACDFK